MAHLSRITEAVSFLVEPLDCSSSFLSQELRAFIVARVGTDTVPWGRVAEAAWHFSCSSRIRPGIPITAFLLSCFIVFIILRNAIVNCLRWYAAARGSAYVAVATEALRELHASCPLLEASHPPGAAPAEAAAEGAALTAPRAAAAHRWYTPSAISAPVVCCACFQPVVAAQGPEGRAQCCELCGVVAHGRCSKAVPHNCRLLALLPTDAGGSATAATAPSAAGGGGGLAAASSPLAALTHDWRPAGTTLDLILPPADTEMLLLGSDNPGAGAGDFPSARPGPSARGPPSLCLYCGEPCEVGLMAVEPVWRCGACRRFAHVQCWAALHPGVLSPAIRAALEGQAMEAEEMLPGSPVGVSPRWAQQLTRCESGEEGPRQLLPPPPAPAASAATGPTAASSSGGGGGAGTSPSAHRLTREASARGTAGSGGGGGGGGGGGPAVPAAAAPPAAAAGPSLWDTSRRCQSLPNIAGGRDGAGGARGSGGGAAASAARGPPEPAGCCPPGQHAAAASGGGVSGLGRTRSPPAVALSGSLPLVVGGHDPRVDPVRLARLDRCEPQASLGPLGAQVLPPTAVARIARGISRIALGVGAGMKAAAGAGGGGKGRAAAAAAAAAIAAPASTTSGGSASTSAPGSSAAASGSAGGGGGGRGRKKQLDRALGQAKKWYHSHAAWSLTAAAAAVDPTGPDRWRHFRLARLPPGCRPLLVFINPRSGPQAGEMIRRQLLQLLHPLQVVDLVREGPGPALRWWWGAAGLRVLVVGGDGTAGWVLGEVDKLAAETAAAAAAAHGGEEPGGGGGSPVSKGAASESAGGASAAAGAAGGGAVGHRQSGPPVTPPVSVLPLGTGNDLARVLGWGGGLAALEARGGVAAVLAEVAAAAPTPLDRWALTVTPTPADSAKRGRSFLQRRRQTAASPARSPPVASSQVKLFNNYCGVGIDSWCALEFHRMRERYPGWFRSQLGNKVWYTGVGARDLLARSCVNLPTRLQLVCDGSPVELPPAAQGILLLSIPSYMGGVDLWGNGVTAHQQQQQQQNSHHHPYAAGQCPHTINVVAGREAAAPGGGGSSGGTPPCAGGGAGYGCDGRERLSSPERPLNAPSALPATPPPPAPAPGSNGQAGVNTPGSAPSRRGGGGSGGSACPGTTPQHGRSTAFGDAAAQLAGAVVGGAAAAAAAAAASAYGSAVSGALSAPPPSGGLTPPAAPPAVTDHPVVPQSMSDGVLEVVAVYGAVHLGQLQVGLARATRLCQCRTAVITTRQPLPMQVDGEPWMQSAAQIVVSLKGSASMLRRLDLSSTASRLTAAVGEVLDGAVARGTITAAQRQALGAELALRLRAPHAV